MKYFHLPLLMLLIFACNPEMDGQLDKGSNGGNWQIPKDEVFDGGPGRDGIPSVDSPKFVTANEINYLSDNDLVIAVTFESEIRVYPHAILNWHEIVNDQLDGRSFAVTYCPLTGTGSNWDTNFSGTVTTFGVSGLLYNSNLIPYDRKTGSNWSQMRLDCVNGDLRGSKTTTYPALETTWGSIKNLVNVTVMTTETGFQRNYGDFPYGDYRTNDSNIIFPVSNTDDRRGAKDRVLGILADGKLKTYGFEHFPADSTKLVVDVIAGKEVLILGNEARNFIVAFTAESGAAYTSLISDFPNILKDEKENIYDIFGRVVSGPDQGSRLDQPTSFIGYWFAWAAFYPELDIY